MVDSYLLLRGEIIAAADLATPRAIALVHVFNAETVPGVRLIECRRILEPSPSDIVVCDIDIVELAQRTVYDIRPTERVAIVFPTEDTLPQVYALREDFPVTPHQNVTLWEHPRSLCLSDEAWGQIKLRWTATGFLRSVREWLTLTARGELHGADQPLEPLIAAIAPPLVIPEDAFACDKDDAFAPFAVIGIKDEGLNDEGGFVAENLVEKVTVAPSSRCLLTSFVGDPQQHGIIIRQPLHLAELQAFVANAGIDLLDILRRRLTRWNETKDDAASLDVKLILLFAFPKTRETDSEAETIETWAFICGENIREIGEAIGIWNTVGGSIGRLLVPDLSKNGENVPVAILKPMYALSRERASALNGIWPRRSERIAAVGMGALGSQVFNNLMRAGYGEWTLIDPDRALPHNFARHDLKGFALHRAKANALAWEANWTIAGEPFARSIVADVLQPGERTVDLEQTFAAADVIIDMSASIAVARHLALDTRSEARRFSLFLNPQGTDLVLLAEDAARCIRLDDLEAQYYRAVGRDAALAGHLTKDVPRIRYARSCGDQSARISQEFVALHAAIGSRALREAIESDEATVSIWRTDTDTLSVARVQHAPHAVHRHAENGWTVYVDDGVLESIRHLRSAKLPNETGGVLIGVHDMQRQIVYIADALESPEDSVEWPTLFIRGCAELREAVETHKSATLGNLEYIGEWHSHPDRVGCAPSPDDERLFDWIAEHMVLDERPAIMLIACSEGHWCRVR